MIAPVFFDIETAPLPDSELMPLLPEFDPESVKLGNLKDPDKVREKLETARRNHVENFRKNAALNANTGYLLGMSVCLDGETYCKLIDCEKSFLDYWWVDCHQWAAEGRSIIGFNIFGFDLPFLVRRSWKHGIYPQVRKGRYWHECFVDLREQWLMGDRNPAHGTSGLDAIAKYFGLPGKLGNGADFYRMSREDQLAYMQRDNELTKAVWEKMNGDLHVRETAGAI